MNTNWIFFFAFRQKKMKTFSGWQKPFIWQLSELNNRLIGLKISLKIRIAMMSNTHKIVMLFQILPIIFKMTCLTQFSNLKSTRKAWLPIKNIFSKSKL